MSKADEIFNNVVLDILRFGEFEDDPSSVRGRYDDGTPALSKSLLNVQLRYDDPSEAPIPTTKKFGALTAINEMRWIWQLKSNRLEDLRAMGIKIWDNWEIKYGEWAGTIGPAYGYVLGQKDRYLNGRMIDQVDYLIHMLTYNPGSRRIKTTLWDVKLLDQMALEPCVWSTQWIKKGGRVHLTVDVRSNDICVGNPFNVFQYHVLQRMICQVTGNEPGSLVFNITDAHIYDRHIDVVKQQIEEQTYDAPELWINPEVKNFYEFTSDDFKIINRPNNVKRYDYEVVI